MILLRCDGGKQVGLGHIRRSLLVGEALARRTGLELHALVRPDPLAEGVLDRAGIPTTRLSTGDDLEAENEAFRGLAKRLGAKMIWVDVFQRVARAEAVSPLRSEDYLVCAVSDENHKITTVADHVFLTSPGLSGASDEVINGVSYHYGPRYFVMPVDYAAAPVAEAARERTILVSLGGVDQRDLIGPVIDTVARLLPEEWSLEIVTGGGYCGKEAIEEELRRRSVRFAWSEDVDDFPRRLRGAALAVTAGGNTLFERLAAGTPGVAVCQSEQQMEHIERLAGFGATAIACRDGGFDDVALERALETVLNESAVRAEMIRAGRTLVDGSGLLRVVDVIARGLTGPKRVA
ncbi:hypothetical protein D5125_03900 [Magnetovirga frankeli]|uniref:hypothetical protein n=1 Tax=Magnetovirga frankeli TaxID=947516 RepID=UPI001293312C|nr:hypothetical protein D5125_03900 [gamma proteobacterium SS-5]